MKYQKGFTAVELLSIVMFAVVAVGAWGWVWNILKIVGSDFGAITGMLVIRLIGIFVAPLGSIVGFF